MKVANVSWNEELDRVDVIFDDEFVNTDRIVHLDVLKDLVIILNMEYERILKEGTIEDSVPCSKYISAHEQAN